MRENDVSCVVLDAQREDSVFSGSGPWVGLLCPARKRSFPPRTSRPIPQDGDAPVSHRNPHVGRQVSRRGARQHQRCTPPMFSSTGKVVTAPSSDSGTRRQNHQGKTARPQKLLRRPRHHLGAIGRRTHDEQVTQRHSEHGKTGRMQDPIAVHPGDLSTTTDPLRHQRSRHPGAPRAGLADDLHNPRPRQPTDQRVETWQSRRVPRTSDRRETFDLSDSGAEGLEDRSVGHRLNSCSAYPLSPRKVGQYLSDLGPRDRPRPTCPRLSDLPGLTRRHKTALRHPPRL